MEREQEKATREQIIHAAKQIYKEFPELLKAVTTVQDKIRPIAPVENH